MSYLDMKVDLSKGIRIEEPLFDSESFREAWTNACVHNRWKDGLPPSVFIYDDRIEVFSYGTIPFTLSEEEFYNGKSRPVNAALFDIFSRLGYVEKSGHGVPIVVSRYGREAFRITDNDVTVTIPFGFEPTFVSSRKQNESRRQDLNEKEVMVLDYLIRDDRAKLSDVSRDLGIGLSSVKMIVSKLKSMGILKNEGTTRNSRWVI